MAAQAGSPEIEREHLLSLPEGIAESRDRLRSIVTRMEQAIAERDFATARSCSDEERIERDKLRSLYQEHGLSGWIFE